MKIIRSLYVNELECVEFVLLPSQIKKERLRSFSLIQPLLLQICIKAF